MMETDRRGFLRALAGTLAMATPGVAGAEAGASALEIHRETRNTRLGPRGPRIPALGRPLPPFKAYPGAERIALPAPVLAPGPPLPDVVSRAAPAPSFTGASIPGEALSRLLHLTNGVTGRLAVGGARILLRAAPSAGALYAGEVYVVAGRVEGLAPGIYYYAVADHQLVRVRAGALLEEVQGALERPAEVEGAAAVVLLTNVFGRYTARYANRGYRYALIDSGHIGENLRLAAISAGLAERAPLRFHDDALAALLRIDGRDEAVCALHAVGRPGPPRPGLLREVRHLVERQQREGFSSGGTAPARYHEATKLDPGGDVAPRPPTDAAAPSSPPMRRHPVPGTSVEDAIRRRRSAMVFRHEPAPQDALRLAGELARGHSGLRRAPGIELQLAVHRVKGLESGLYRIHADTGELSPHRLGELAGPLVQACGGQEKAGQAAVGFLMVARLQEAAGRAGDRSYRDLLLEAGGIGQRIYLAAEATGLAARNLAAFRDDDLNRLVDLDGVRQAVVHLTMFGPGD